MKPISRITVIRIAIKYGIKVYHKVRSLPLCAGDTLRLDLTIKIN